VNIYLFELSLFSLLPSLLSSLLFPSKAVKDSLRRGEEARAPHIQNHIFLLEKEHRQKEERNPERLRKKL
jgi:hypothetical protein